MDKKFDSVKHRILDEIKKMAPNEKLPSERVLIETFGFSRPTIQKALSDLEADGYIYRIPRQGSFVADRRLHKSLNRLKSFAEDLSNAGDTPSTRLLAFEILPADKRVAQHLSLEEGEDVFHIIRLRYKNGDPIIYDDSYFAPFSVKGITCEVLVSSIYRYVEACGHVISMAQESIDAVLPPAEIASALNLGENEPVLKIDMTAYLSDGRPFEYTISHKNPKKYFLELNSYR